MRRSVLICGLVLVATASAFTFDAVAGGEPSVVARAMAKRTTPPAAAAPPLVPQQYLYLVRATLGALHDANSSGNYTVLRDLSAPSFQAKHTAADLTDIFAAARRRPVDLAPAALTAPILSDAARPDPSTLHLKGHIPTGNSATHPERIAFALSYEAVNGHWRLAAISISTAN